MATYLRGQQGLVEFITERRDALQQRLKSDAANTIASHRMQRAERERLFGEIGGYNYLLAALTGGLAIETPEAYDRRMVALHALREQMAGSS